MVAALTMPSLIASHKEMVLVKSAKKSFSVLTNAVNMWNNDEGTLGEYLSFFASGANNDDRLNALAKYLNVTKICKQSNINKCGGKYTIRQYKKINNGSGQTQQADSYMYVNRAVLADGTFVSVVSEVQNGSCTHTYWSNEKDENGYYIDDPSSPTGKKGQYNTSSNCGFIFFDTNGLKAPNQIGADVFAIGFGNTGKYWISGDMYGNLNYVLLNDKLPQTENYTVGDF